MRRYYFAFLLLFVAVVASTYFGRTTAKPLTFRAHLTGQSVFPPVNTLAQGDATFQLDNSGDDLTFALTVRALENVTEAHIHAGSSADSLGQVIVTLYKDEALPGPFDGIIARGVITTKDFKGPLMDQPMSALITMFADGLAFVDVHTEQHSIAEIRGQVK